MDCVVHTGHVIECESLENNGKLDCISNEPGYSFNGKPTKELEVVIGNMSAKQEGKYLCYIAPKNVSTSPDMRPCFLRHHGDNEEQCLEPIGSRSDNTVESGFADLHTADEVVAAATTEDSELERVPKVLACENETRSPIAKKLICVPEYISYNCLLHI
ncbi:hypothetical protein BaRGS_00033041 [Batillaria attramentaria]|uniref:Uncharacterized protein n=1 Tax=Batillaria attramentaria TaxID=370345 RepID=A0ABD0JLK5_9CAEN